MTRVANWVRSDNAIVLLLELSKLVEYPFDDLDADALDFDAIARGEQRSYSLVGEKGQAEVTLTPELGSNVLSFAVDLPEVYASAVRAVIGILQDYKAEGPPRWLTRAAFNHDDRVTLTDAD